MLRPRFIQHTTNLSPTSQPKMQNNMSQQSSSSSWRRPRACELGVVSGMAMARLVCANAVSSVKNVSAFMTSGFDFVQETVDKVAVRCWVDLKSR